MAALGPARPPPPWLSFRDNQDFSSFRQACGPVEHPDIFSKKADARESDGKNRVKIYAALLRLAIPDRPRKPEPKRYTAAGNGTAPALPS